MAAVAAMVAAVVAAVVNLEKSGGGGGGIKDKSRKSILSNYQDCSCSHSNMRSMVECI